jgi:FG-GAP-like repeat/FG-GAP repeat
VTADFNRDGIADVARIIVHADGTADPASLIVLLGETNGASRQITSQPVPGQNPRAMVGGDFNNDGIPDLIVGSEDGTLALFVGDGTGSFGSVQKLPALSSVVSIAFADFNNDGIADVAVSDWRASSVTVLLGMGNGSFNQSWSFPLRMRGTKPHIAAADFNGDGVPDLAVIYDQDDGDTFDVMLGNGNGSFTIEPERGLVRNPNSHCNIL